ncbi:MAG: transporter substrate-binding domain-containing protein [Alphaproteobacteria bacterium]|nr:transporter substrate-binding domain-containing protein [Alphaproteobacteria bacterium]
MKKTTFALAAAALIAAGASANAQTPARTSTLDAVKGRGVLTCGVNTALPGFSSPNSQGVWQGLDVDMCKAIAAAVFGDATKTKYVPTTSQQRFVALQSGEIDVLTRNATQTLLRDTTLGLHMAGVNFYDGQGFIVKRSMNVTSAKQLDGATICVQPGTTTELNLADYFRSNKMKFTPVVIERLEENIAAYQAGRCDVYTTDASGLASVRSNLQVPADHVILPERVSKEPLGPMVRKGDDQWFAIVKWTLTAMIEAEEYGVTQANVDEMLKSTNPGIQRMLGVTPGFGKALGLDEKWAYNVIKQVGNYADSYERNVGPKTPIGLERGVNDLWTKGGLMYALPLR